MKKSQMPNQAQLQSQYPQMDADTKQMICSTFQRLRESKEDKPVMKKKMSLGMVLAAALVLLTCAALAAATNVFGLFAEQQKETRFGELYQKLSTQSEANATVIGGTENVTFTLSETYYDGENLYVSYILSGSLRTYDETWKPTEEEAKRFEKVCSVDEADAADMLGVDADFVQRMTESANKNGTAYAAVKSLFLGDGAYVSETDEYLDLCMSDESKLADGSLAGIKQFETPLPDSVRNREEIFVDFSLYSAVNYYKLDGEGWYAYASERVWLPLTVSIRKNAQVLEKSTATAEGEMNGFRVAATIEEQGLTQKITVHVKSTNGVSPFGDFESAGALSGFDIFENDRRVGIISGEGPEEEAQEGDFIYIVSLKEDTEEITLIPQYYDDETNRQSSDKLTLTVLKK